MSTILEALKKSERERKLNNLPTLSDMPPPQERAQWPVALLVMICLLLIALLVIVTLHWWQTDSTTEEVRVISNETLEQATPQEANVASDDILVSVVSYSPEPAQRFAMINGKLVRENEFVRAGLKVEKIEPDSVVLIHRGERIKRAP